MAVSHWNSWGSERNTRAGEWSDMKCAREEAPLLAHSMFQEITVIKRAYFNLSVSRSLTDPGLEIGGFLSMPWQ